MKLLQNNSNLQLEAGGFWKEYLGQPYERMSVYKYNNSFEFFLADTIYDYSRHDEWYRGVMQELRNGLNREMG